MPEPLSWKIGLGMKDGLAVLERRVLDDVLEQHEPVGGLQQGAEADVDLGLAGVADLVVLDLDRDAGRLQGQGHLRAQVLVVVGRRTGSSLLVAGLVPEVGSPSPAPEFQAPSMAST